MSGLFRATGMTGHVVRFCSMESLLGCCGDRLLKASGGNEQIFVRIPLDASFSGIQWSCPSSMLLL